MSHDRTEIENSVDYSLCPIPKSHRCLVDAHVLWHQTLDHYQEPEVFRANLNATIEALRNITFKLQNEKGTFTDFDAWYKPHKERLKADPVCKWVHDARTTVVHQGELSAHSTAVVKLVTWRDEPLVETTVAPDAPPDLILRNISLVELISAKKIAPGDVETAAVFIERRWNVTGLEGREILDALAEAYGLLSEIVLGAHIYIGKSFCIPIERSHLHFRSTYHRTQTLRCMAVGIEQRTHRFELATGEQLQEVNRQPGFVEPAIVMARYGLQKGGLISKWQSADPVMMAERILYTAKRALTRDKGHIRILFLRDGKGNWSMVRLDAENRAEKHLLMRMVARIIESTGGDALIDVSEMWVLPHKVAEKLKLTNPDQIQHAPGREEMLQVLVATRDGLLRTYDTPFKRGPLRGIRLGETRQSDNSRKFFYLEPVFAVWRKQGATRLPDGQRRRRLWEPDPLDTCFCGGPNRFLECCRRLVSPQATQDGIEENIAAAMKSKNFGRAEELARAAVAQYVIWIRQHTVMTRHVASDLHKTMLETDLLALEAHVRKLGEVLEANGHAESFVPQLRELSGMVGLPELSVRLVAIAAERIFLSNDLASATKELETLGDFDEVNDTLALVLASRLLGWSDDKQRNALLRAISGAVTKEEKWFAEFELSRSLLGCGTCGVEGEARKSRHPEALRVVDRLISELREDDGHQGLLADAWSLRWEITGNQDDFLAAKKEMEICTDSMHQLCLAGLMIDHGDFDDAETFLTDALKAADPVAQLLVVDARLRGGRRDDARDLFQSITAERGTPQFEYAYAVTCAILALACDDAELKSLAQEKLQNLHSIDPHAREHVADLLRTLDDSALSVSETILERVRNFLRRE